MYWHTSASQIEWLEGFSWPLTEPTQLASKTNLFTWPQHLSSHKSSLQPVGSFYNMCLFVQLCVHVYSNTNSVVSVCLCHATCNTHFLLKMDGKVFDLGRAVPIYHCGDLTFQRFRTFQSGLPGHCTLTMAIPSPAASS